jgi:putative phosphoribosyl transferase
MEGNMSFPPTAPNSVDPVLFTDRTAAGVALAAAVQTEAQAWPDAQFVVYALPRGGVPIGAPIARALNCPLEVVIAKKITRPDNPELAIGAVTADDQALWLHPPSDPSLPLKPWHLVALQQAQAKAQAQLAEFAPYTQLPSTNTIALLVDDGIATGMTVAVAAKALRARRPRALWICVPVAPSQLMPALQTWCDRLIVLATPDPFLSVSRFYQIFDQVETATALAYLAEAREQE